MDLRASTHKSTIPISVVIPVYGRPDLLSEALESVASQTRSPAEVIVVDDGSEEAAEIAEVANRFGARLIRQQNAGPSSARNVGLAAARNEWVAFLDGDDMWLSRKLELQWNAIHQTNGFGAVISNFRVVTSQGAFDDSAFDVIPEYRTIEKRMICPDTYELCAKSAGQALARSMFVQPSGLLVRRDIALGIGGFEDRMRRCEDHEFALRLFAVTRILSVENPVVRYRARLESLSRQSEVEMRLGELVLAERVLSNPERYPPGAADVIKEARPLWVRKAAASFIKEGNVGSARSLLRENVSGSGLTCLMYAATWLVPRRLAHAKARFILGIWRRRPWHRAQGWESASAPMVAELRGELHK